MKRLLWVGALLGLVVAAGGLIVAAAGVIPIRASSGHWPLTRWFLEFSMERSVSTYALGTEVPDLSDSALVVRGAAHYETGCRSCHGAPGRARSGVALGLTPSPPILAPIVRRWKTEELFYIVKHGVKMTGMPAWPAVGRDDEVWAVVAFLLELPALSEEGYEELAFGDPAPAGSAREAVIPESDDSRTRASPVAARCARCHGLDGASRGVGAFPRLAHQSYEYLVASLEAYRGGFRPSGIMEPIASSLDPEMVHEVAEHYASVGRSVTDTPETDADRDPTTLVAPVDVATAAPSLARGEAIAREGLPEQNVPPCVDCHGPIDRARNPRFPSLAGQHAGYLVGQLRLFEQDRRGGSAYAGIMPLVVRGMDEEAMRDVAAWYASLPIGRR
jgi:cytochrome c553